MAVQSCSDSDLGIQNSATHLDYNIKVADPAGLVFLRCFL